MGNKQLNKRKPSRRRQLKRFQKTMEAIKNQARKQAESAEISDALRKHLHNPKRLEVLCKQVINKYKLQKRVKDDKLEVSLVGGKPLRKRKEAPPKSEVKKTVYQSQPKPKKKKSQNNEVYNPVRSSYQKQREDPSRSMLSINPEPALRVKVEQDFPHDEDPLCPEEDYTIEIKEEPFELEAHFDNARVEVEPAKPEPVPLVEKSAPSTSVSSYPLGTVVMDDIQIFANRVAEQLRAMPADRALLLQVDIQCMIDNEKQLLMDEQ